MDLCVKISKTKGNVAVAAVYIQKEDFDEITTLALFK